MVAAVNRWQNATGFAMGVLIAVVAWIIFAPIGALWTFIALRSQWARQRYLARIRRARRPQPVPTIVFDETRIFQPQTIDEMLAHRAAQRERMRQWEQTYLSR